MEEQVNVNECELAELGFEKAAKDLKEAKEFERKCAIAYEHFARRVSKIQIDEFNKKLRERTVGETNNAYIYDRLVLTDISEYPTIPPVNVLTALKEAQKLDIFDYYEIAHIESITEKKDPILFGCINKLTDRFFIAQWDDDISIEDLLSPEQVNVEIKGVQIP